MEGEIIRPPGTCIVLEGTPTTPLSEGWGFVVRGGAAVAASVGAQSQVAGEEDGRGGQAPAASGEEGAAVSDRGEAVD